MKQKKSMPKLEKAPSGISGLDEITFGGLPKGRTTLICGAAGCGKTVFAMEFLVAGTLKYNEPGVFLAFEENVNDLKGNFSSLGFDLEKLCQQKKIFIDYIHIDRSEIHETGEYDLEGLFVRLEHAVKSVGAKRVALDTLEAVFSGFSNPAILRAELRRLFRWLKDHDLTAVVTGERGDKTYTRYGLEEYVSDCVISLDHRLNDEIPTRRLQVVKYRGSKHGTNEYPFIIDEDGISVLPVSSLTLDHKVTNDRISSGIKALDDMAGMKGFYRGSTILISGASGTGKTSLGAHFAQASCQRNEKCLYFAFEESVAQIERNMSSIGLDLHSFSKKGLLTVHATRPTLYGLEMHLLTMHKLITEHRPQMVVIDPLTNMLPIGTELQIQSMFTRLIDFLKSQNITAIFISLTPGGKMMQSEIGISSLIDSWIVLQDLECGFKREHSLFILKSRGMAHSNEIQMLEFTNHGLRIFKAPEDCKAPKSLNPAI